MGIRSLISLLMVFNLLWGAKPAHRESNNALPGNLSRSAGIVEFTAWDGNQIFTWHGNNGDWVSDNVTGNSGLEWPKGSGKLAVYHSGLWLAAGRVRAPGGDWKEEIRTAGAEYVSEFVPGTIDGEGGHIYEIHRAELDAFLNNDFATYSQMSAELPITQGANRVTTTVHFPTRDFENWPAHHGASWVDANGDGVYNIEDGDHPDILGDQFHWYVMNDADAAQHTPLWGTSPLNVEVHNSVFGFDQAGPLGNIMFTRTVIINKGTDDLDSMFASIWHDDDVGDATDDLVGSDTTLSLGYTYNDADGDATYGTGVPATGSDFFQGPLVSSPGDTASIFTWSLEKGYHIREVPDYKELSMTSFVAYINPNPTLRDPETDLQAYRFMNAQIGLTGEPFKDPNGQITNFVFSGDPVRGTGWVDGDEFPPGDRRYLMTSGPFYMGRGDTIEVVGCMIMAGGSTWDRSVTVLKYFDSFAQTTFDGNFEVCSPPSPSVSVAQLDKKVVLTFEEGSETVESYRCLDYRFEGYNIYQGESPNGPWHRIATYDIVNTPSINVIKDFVLDEVNGLIIEIPVQFGSDSEIEHHLVITSDAIRREALINGRRYYFSVTAYAYDEANLAKRVIESPIKPITAIPMEPVLGAALGSASGELLDVTHVSGISDAVIKVQVVDPFQLTNDTYQLSADGDSETGAETWDLENITDNTFIFSDQSTLPEESIFITDGFILTFEAFFGAPASYGSATHSEMGSDTTELVFLGLNEGSAIGQGVTFAKVLESIPEYPVGGTRSPELLQLDLRMVFNNTGSNAARLNGSLTGVDGTIHVPFELWTVEDSSRISVAVWPVNIPASYDSLTKPDHSFYHVWIIPVYRDYDPDLADVIDLAGGQDTLQTTLDFGWVFKFTFDGSSVWSPGDEFILSFLNPIVPGVDVFTFVGSGVTTASDDQIKVQLDKINVFPNPYFGRNVEEVNPLDRFVTFTHLGVGNHIIRIFSLSGDLVSRIEQDNISENDPANLVRWDLRNNAGIPVASGMYIAYIQSKVNDKTYEKTLKLAIFQPEERLDVY